MESNPTWCIQLDNTQLVPVLQTCIAYSEGICCPDGSLQGWTSNCAKIGAIYECNMAYQSSKLCWQSPNSLYNGKFLMVLYS